MPTYKDRNYTVEPYHQEWKSEFETLTRPLASLFGLKALRIEHVGSTSVEGLAGKPTIDILITVGDIVVADAVAPRIEELGYVSLGEYVTKGARLFAKEKGNIRLVNVHIFPQNHPYVRDMLHLRDYFRSHPEAVAEYSTLKFELQKKYPNDYSSYRKYKDEWIEKFMTAIGE